jgi:hypothetical protein
MPRAAHQVEQTPTRATPAGIAKHNQGRECPQKARVGKAVKQIVRICPWPDGPQDRFEPLHLQNARGDRWAGPAADKIAQLREQGGRAPKALARIGGSWDSQSTASGEKPDQGALGITLAKALDCAVVRRCNRAHLPEYRDAVDHRVLVAIAAQYAVTYPVARPCQLQRNLEAGPAAWTQQDGKQMPGKLAHRQKRSLNCSNVLPVSVPNSQFATIPTLRIWSRPISG